MKQGVSSNSNNTIPLIAISLAVLVTTMNVQGHEKGRVYGKRKIFHRPADTEGKRACRHADLSSNRAVILKAKYKLKKFL